MPEWSRENDLSGVICRLLHEMVCYLCRSVSARAWEGEDAVVHIWSSRCVDYNRTAKTRPTKVWTKWGNWLRNSSDCGNIKLMVQLWCFYHNLNFFLIISRGRFLQVLLYLVYCRHLYGPVGRIASAVSTNRVFCSRCDKNRSVPTGFRSRCDLKCCTNSSILIRMLIFLWKNSWDYSLFNYFNQMP